MSQSRVRSADGPRRAHGLSRPPGDQWDRYRALVDAAFEGLCIHEHGVIREANPAFARLFGYAEGEMEGLEVERLVHPQDHAMLRTRLARPEDNAYEIRCVRRDGSTMHVEVRAQDVVYQGRPMRATAVRDLTERIEANAATEAARARAREIARLQQRDDQRAHLVRATTHELRTPIVPIRFNLDMLESGKLGPLTEAQRRVTAMARRNLERLHRLVDDLLDVSRLEAGQMPLDIQEGRLADVLTGVCDAFEAEAAEAGVALERDWPTLPPIRMDADRISQVLFNLVSNALKFTPHGGMVTIGASLDLDRFTVWVRDTGRGLDEEEAARLFVPFAQARAEDAKTGTGLGLVVAKGIVEAHGGRIRCESDGRERGTRFVFELPREGPDGSAA